MSKLNLLIHVNAYEDSNPTNNPSRNNFKWNRDQQGLDISEPASQSIKLPAGQSLTLFDNGIANGSDDTTLWDIALKAGTSQTYKISKSFGTSPAFRTARNPGADATTEITVTKNATLLTLSSTGGTALDLIVGGAVVGDEVRIGSLFNAVNRGKFKILALTATSLTIENASGQAEGPITLGSGFADQLSVQSANGVQVGYKVEINAYFSPVTFGTYEITDVAPDYIEIHSTDPLPAETGVENTGSGAFIIYENAKQFIYIESDKKLEVKVNYSQTPNAIEPMQAGSSTVPGMFMSSASLRAIQITNKSSETANIFYVTAE